YAFCKEVANPLMRDPYDINEAVGVNLKLLTYANQTPQVFSPDNQGIFENPEEAISTKGIATLPVLSAKGNAFVLSIGVSEYPNNNINLRFNNSDDDAIAYNEYFTKQFDYFKDNKSKFIVQSVLLQNQQATKQKIIDGIYRAINETKPDDYFVFNFSGFCKPLTDSNGKQVTYFIPYGLHSITDSIEIIKNGIALKELKDLFQLIPANNQLFITEAGSTEDFQKEFIQALIETSPTISSLSNKNRIFLVPKSSGLDNFTCQNVTVEHGPLNYYLTNLSDDLNIYGLFNGGIYADAVRFALNKTEVNCQFFRTGYFDIFFEKDFVKDLKNYLPDDVMQSRGTELLKKNKAIISSAISNRYALVVGTDKYLGKPNWSDLPNPILDATDISKELRDVYGFKVKQLDNPPADSVYSQLLKYASILKSTDQLIVYFAGHGDFDDLLFDDGFIVCNNSLPAANDPYRNSYIQYSKLSRMINKLPAQQVLMILDVCFGGSFNERVIKNNAGGTMESRVARDETNTQSELYKDLNSENYFSLKMKKKTRLYISSGPESVPDGYKGKHSPFAFRLLEALQTNGGTQKMLTAGDLYQYVKKLPSGPLMGGFGDDVQGSEFILLAK
ncbi:MAG: caspase family protein, partial [Ferruginibacter sp.]|nr:caspase family protein [Ferruginibacter sp.]